MSVAFKEDDVLVSDIPGATAESLDETCSVSYDSLGRIVLIVNNTSGVKEFRAYYSNGITTSAIHTFFDIDNNYLISALYND